MAKLFLFGVFTKGIRYRHSYFCYVQKVFRQCSKEKRGWGILRGSLFAVVLRVCLICVFADDSIIFCRANMSECQKVWDILHDYEVASGQKINKDKNSLFFNKSTGTSTQAEIKNLFGAQVIKQHERYLAFHP